MALAYEVMYRIGFTPWDNHEISVPLTDLVKGSAPGHLLDVGCGTGNDARFAAQHGWRVTGIDAVSVAVRRARRTVADAGDAVTIVHGDIARADAAELGDDFTVVHDMGCIAGLSDADRARAAALISSVSLPGARLLMFYFGPGGGRGPGPRRMEPGDVTALFPGWVEEFQRAADEVQVGGPAKDAPRYWHQLVKR